MLPLSLDVRKKFGLPLGICWLILGMGLLNLLATAIEISYGKEWRWQWLSFHAENPDPLQFVISIFSHASWEHWFWNCFYLWVFGAPLEDRLGWKKFLLLFLICGLAGSLLNYLLYLMIHLGEAHPPASWGLGASGAVFGIMGLTQARFRWAKLRMGIASFGLGAAPLLSYKIPVTWLCGFRFLLELLSAGMNDGIGHLVHVSGFLAGLACAQYLGFKEESESEQLETTAQDLFDYRSFQEAQEYYERVIKLNPRNPAGQVGKLRCLHAKWPRTTSIDPTQKSETLRQLERCLELYFSLARPMDAVDLSREFVPPFLLEDLSPKLQLQINAARHTSAPKPGQSLHPEEQKELLGEIRKNFSEACAAGDWTRATHSAKQLLDYLEEGQWTDGELLAGAEVLSRAKDKRGADLAFRLANRGNEDQVFKALLLLERNWKGRPEQARFQTLLPSVETRFVGLGLDPRYLEMKARLVTA